MASRLPVRGGCGVRRRRLGNIRDESGEELGVGRTGEIGARRRGVSRTSCLVHLHAGVLRVRQGGSEGCEGDRLGARSCGSVDTVQGVRCLGEAVAPRPLRVVGWDGLLVRLLRAPVVRLLLELYSANHVRRLFFATEW